jgi:hypothetical protein
MGAILVPIVLVVAVLVVLGLGVRTFATQRRAVADELAQERVPTLDYVVPPGQDPVVLLTALSAEGYAATADPRRADLLHISTPAGPDRDRAHVRATIASAHDTALDTPVTMDPGEVRFTDER